jgi:hypothetical protein
MIHPKGTLFKEGGIGQEWGFRFEGNKLFDMDKLDKQLRHFNFYKFVLMSLLSLRIFQTFKASGQGLLGATKTATILNRCWEEYSQRLHWDLQTAVYFHTTTPCLIYN